MIIAHHVVEMVNWYAVMVVLARSTSNAMTRL